METSHGATRIDDDTVRIVLTARERQLLRSLPEQLRPLITDEGDGAAEGEGEANEARARLFPAAYEDPTQEAEYRELVQDSLSEERAAAVDTFAETLEGGEEGSSEWAVTLSDEQTGAWLSAVNDARLVLSSLLGITSEEQWEQGPDEENPASVALYYLGWLEEELVASLAGGLPDDTDAGDELPDGEPPDDELPGGGPLGA